MKGPHKFDIFADRKIDRTRKFINTFSAPNQLIDWNYPMGFA